MSRLHIDRVRLLGTTSTLLPLGLSIAANLVWGVEARSWVDVVAGLFTPLVLALAVERFYAVGALGKWLRAAQIGGLAIVALVAASWSWVHTAALLLAHQPPPEWWMPGWLLPALCMSAPLAVDGLAVLSVLALAAPPAVAPTRKLVTLAVSPGTWGGPETVPPASPVTLPPAAASGTPVSRHTVTELRPGARDDLDALVTVEELRSVAKAENVAIRGSRDEIRRRIRTSRRERAVPCAAAVSPSVTA